MSNLSCPNNFIEIYNKAKKENLLSRNYLVNSFSVSPTVIDRWLKENNLEAISKSNKKKEEIIDFDSFVEDCSSGSFSYADLKNKYNLSKRSIINIIERNKISEKIVSDKFSPDVDEVLLLLNESGSWTEVAKKYGVSLSVILNFRDKNKLSTEKYFGNKRKLDVESVKKDLLNGYNINEISNIYSVSRSVIKRIVNENNLIHPLNVSENWKIGNDYIDSRFEEFVEMNKNGKTLKEISIKENVSIDQLKKSFKKKNVPVLLHSYNKSAGEKEVKEFIKSLGFDCISIKRTHNQKRFEIDCFVPDLNFGIEYCGEFWHSFNNGTERTYHYDKYKWCKDQGIVLMTIFENEWRNKNDIIKSMILSRLFLSNRIYARKTVAKEIDNVVARRFHEENHINGHINSSLNYGLFHNDVLVEVLSLSKSRFDKTSEYEITRLSTLKNHNVVGGFSKLLKFSGIRSLMTYADLRFGSGDVYLNNGFVLKNSTPPNYWYINKKDPRNGFESRMKYQKKKLTGFSGYSDSKTEYNIMKENGFLRVYDCGSNKFIFNS